MRFALSTLVALLLTGYLANANPPAATPPAATPDGWLKVMTYNLKFASARGADAWPTRRPIMKDCIRSVGPDLIGTQEGLYAQLKDMAADMPEYEWMGVGRDGGSRGEFMAIFYRKDRLDPLEYDYYWLSDTPEVVASSTWGNTSRRMVWQIRFLDKQTGQQFWHINTHLDNAIQGAREKAAQLIVQRTQKLGDRLPIIFTADANADQRNKVYSMLVNEDVFADTWFAAGKHFNEQANSWNNWQAPAMQGLRIDWILSRGPVAVEEEGVVTYSKDGQNPSDHFPVAAKLRFVKPPATQPAAGR